MTGHDDQVIEAEDDTGLDNSAVDGEETPAIEALDSDVHSVVAREPVRSRLAADLDAFLSGGGNIEEVPRDFRANPPKRPQSTYGRGSI
jgi:hypothetical protein